MTDRWQRMAHRMSVETRSFSLMCRSGLVAPMNIPTLLGASRAVRRFGPLGGLAGVAAVRYGDRVALIDELGQLSFTELEAGSNAVANGWRAAGFQDGETIGILARNHRWFLYAVVAGAKLGARIVLLNTDFAGPQLRDVVAREGIDLLVFDDEFAPILADIEVSRLHWQAWSEQPGDRSLRHLIDSTEQTPPRKPLSEPQVVLLTSGTTGLPKGAPRAEPRSLTVFGGLLSKVPVRTGGVTEVAAPMFHTLGFSHAMAALAFGCTLVVRRRFDPEATVRSLGENQVTGLAVVPVMLRRLLEVPEQAWKGIDSARLEWIFVAGSQLGSDLAERALERFGPVLHNMYGSTEVAYATIATPDDLLAAPGCVGQPVLGSSVAILDGDGNEVRQGVVGRIFVGGFAQFEGYTGGGGKEVIRGLMSSGDMGHFDDAGRLFIDGRDDEMIVSGGENVFPGEVEELLTGHPSVAEVAVIGVADDTYGERLAAFVVRQPNDLIEADMLQTFVRDHLARYKVPRQITFMEELPRNPTGKVLKRVLRESLDA